jgi:hypothetical protein
MIGDHGPQLFECLTFLGRAQTRAGAHATYNFDLETEVGRTAKRVKLMRCSAKTKSGKRCKHKAQADAEFCGVHSLATVATQRRRSSNARCGCGISRCSSQGGSTCTRPSWCAWPVNMPTRWARGRSSRCWTGGQLMQVHTTVLFRLAAFGVLHRGMACLKRGLYRRP